jgi:hypothetical protein
MMLALKLINNDSKITISLHWSNFMKHTVFLFSLVSLECHGSERRSLRRLFSICLRILEPEARHSRRQVRTSCHFRFKHLFSPGNNYVDSKMKPLNTSWYALIFHMIFWSTNISTVKLGYNYSSGPAIFVRYNRGLL